MSRNVQSVKLENTGSSQAQPAKVHLKHSDNAVIIQTAFNRKEIHRATFTV